MNSKTKALATTSLAAAAIFPAIPAMAQDTAPAAEESGNNIIVTARKIEENIQDIPASITALSKQDLEERNIAQLDCLLYTSPSPRDRQKSRMPSSA